MSDPRPTTSNTAGRGSASDVSPDANANQRSSPKEGAFFRLRRSAHRTWPRVFSYPITRETLASLQADDPDENAKIAPPADEHIDLRCLWAVEFYTPSHIDALLEAFRDLGWETDERDATRSPGGWLQRLRERPYGGGTFNLGPLVPPDSRGPRGLSRSVPLPAHVQYATGTLYSLTSSLSCICIGFVFDETYSDVLDKALRTAERTYTEPTKRGYRIVGPLNQKVARVRDIRRNMQLVALRWFRDNFPGLFAAGLLGDHIPTCEFVSLRQADPFVLQPKGTWPPNYLFALDIDHDIDAWFCADAPGLKFASHSSRRADQPFHAILAMKENAIDAERFRAWGTGRRAEIAYVDRVVNSLLSRWAVLPLLTGHTRHLNAVLDSTHVRSDALRILNTLGRHVSFASDIAAVTSQLIPFASKHGLSTHALETFKPARADLYKDTEYTLADGLRFSIVEQATWLEKAEPSVRDLLTQYGSLLGSEENVRLQRKLSALTWIIVVLTIAIFLLTFLTLLVAVRGPEGVTALSGFLTPFTDTTN